MSSRARLLARTWLASLLLLGACSAGEGAETGAPKPAPPAAAPSAAAPAVDSYVALGDSFTAAPFVPTTDLAEGCFRSSGNYPSLLAERLGVTDFTDVSCSGADTRDLRRPQQTLAGARVPAQLDAVGPGTDLVTLGIGGNDFGLFSTLVRTCARLGGEDPDGAPCADRLADDGVDLLGTAGRIGDRVARAVRQVRRQAPDARVLLVGYPRLTPEQGSCPALPFANGDYARAVEISEALNEALRDAARRTGATFVDMYAASEGHDVCSDEPWVNGRRTDRAAALAFHPFAAAMEATADEVEAALAR